MCLQDYFKFIPTEYFSPNSKMEHGFLIRSFSFSPYRMLYPTQYPHCAVWYQGVYFIVVPSTPCHQCAHYATVCTTMIVFGVRGGVPYCMVLHFEQHAKEKTSDDKLFPTNVRKKILHHSSLVTVCHQLFSSRYERYCSSLLAFDFFA